MACIFTSCNIVRHNQARLDEHVTVTHMQLRAFTGHTNFDPQPRADPRKIRAVAVALVEISRNNH